jgi:hypothetical protein
MEEDTTQIITKDAYHHIEALSDLAPLHNGAALGIVESCIRKLPDTTNLACFDTQFHMSLPTSCLHISHQSREGAEERPKEIRLSWPQLFIHHSFFIQIPPKGRRPIEYYCIASG